MTVREQACFIAACDDCQEDYEHDYTPHWPSAGEAVDDAVGTGEWWSKGDALLCPTCKEKPHAFVVSDLLADDCDRCEHGPDSHEDPAEAAS